MKFESSKFPTSYESKINAHISHAPELPKPAQKIVVGIALRPLSDDESEGTRIFAYLELGKKSLWSILGKETTKRLVPLWLEAFKMAARERCAMALSMNF